MKKPAAVPETPNGIDDEKKTSKKDPKGNKDGKGTKVKLEKKNLY